MTEGITPPLDPAWRPRIVESTASARAIEMGATPLQARLIGSRVGVDGNLGAVLAPRDEVLHWKELPDIDVAASRIAQAVQQNEHIGVLLDHDCDGVFAAAVVREALVDHFGMSPDHVTCVVTHRTREGYGLSDRFVERVLALDPRPSLVITVDQGSTDEPRIRRLREEDVVTVVTDHHGVPEEGVPRSALACVNPARTDIPCRDSAIAGCMVAFLVMCAVRARLIDDGWLSDQAPSLAPLLEFVAIGTMADAVNLGTSATNRYVMQAGLARLAHSQRPFVRAFAEHVPRPWDSKTLGWSLAPPCNASGRIGDASLALDFVLESSFDRARTLCTELLALNENRKTRERELTATAMEQARRAIEDGCQGLALILENGHPGLHGISAGRIAEAFGRATVCLSPHMEDASQLTGSVRSIPGVDARVVLGTIAQQFPECGIVWGGHAMAAGLRAPRSRGLLFVAAWDAVVSAVLAGAPIYHNRWHDGPLGDRLGVQALDEIRALEPWGRGFEPPVFCDRFTVDEVRAVGDGTHLRLTLRMGRRRFVAIWFRAIHKGDALPIAREQIVEVVYALEAPNARSRGPFEMYVRAAWAVAVEGAAGLKEAV